MSEFDLNGLITGITEALEVEAHQVNIDTKSSDLEEWDSLGHISIMVFLDKSFNEATERAPALASATSVREIADILSSLE
jgi:acyl carrier protein